MKLESPMAGDVETPLLAHAHSHDASAREHRKKPLTLLPLIALIFFEVSGGPFGTEDAVAAGGPLLVLAGFLVLPLLWSVPEALITAELATAFPENSGYVAWVTAAFGPFWGFQEGFWSWLSGVTDNSIYPVMFADNLRIFVPALNDGWPRMLFVLALSFSLTYLNYRGLNVVGHTAMTTTIFIIAPFVLLCGLAAPHAQPANWMKFDPGAVQWSTFLNIMFWNLNYWDSISCLAGEVDTPSRTFPRALLWAVLLVVASYFLPTLAALGVTIDSADWELGYYGKVAQQVGGNWLAWWIVLAAAASQIGQFQAEMSSDSYQLQGMAERGFLPKALASRSKHGTPTYGILLSSLGVMCLASFSFVDIVELLNAIYCLAELLEFAAYIWLRIRAPNLPRPYKVPLPTWGLVLMLLPATALLLAILIIPLYERNFVMIGITSAAMVAGFLLYPLMQLCKERRWLKFADLEFDFEHETAGAGLTYTITATGGLNNDPSYNAEYVDVMHDGVCRTTGSSMDLGSVSFGGSRGPASLSGSMGRSPRSPLSLNMFAGWAAAPAAAGAGGAGGVGSHGDAGGGDGVMLRVGSAPAAAAAAGGGRQGGNGSSRLRPGGAGVGGFRGGGLGTADWAAAAAAAASGAADGAVEQGGGGASGVGDGGTDSRRLPAGQQLSSFHVRVSHETSFSDSGDGPGSPRDQVDDDGPGGAAVQALDSTSGSGSGSGSRDGKRQGGADGGSSGSDLIKL